MRSTLLLAAIGSLFATSLEAQTVYRNDFESGATAGWSTSVTSPAFQRPITTSRNPTGDRRFLGDFGSQNVRFSTGGLPRHDSLVVELDLYVLRSWDGNRIDTNGPDVFSVADAEAGALLRTTFTNKEDHRQAYPGPHPGGDYAAFTGAVAISSLGYNDGDAIYRLSFAYPHSGSQVDLTFAANLRDVFPTLQNESWGIDNITISVVAPGSASATLVAGETTGAPGERIIVPIYLRDVVSVASSGATAVRTRLRFNASMLVPVSPTPEGVVEGNDRVIELTMPTIIPGDSAIDHLPFEVVVGNDTVTALTLESSSAIGGEIALREQAGLFRVRGLCEDGGVRLFREQPAVLLRSPVPNPARDRAVLSCTLAAGGAVRLEILDARGRIVREVVDGERAAGSFDEVVAVDGLAAGVYTVRLVAADGVRETRLVVIR